MESMSPRVSDRRMQFAAILIFLLPAMALTTHFGMTLALLVMVAATLWAGKHAALPVLRRHGRALAWVIAGFAGYFLVSLGRLVFDVRDLGVLDGPSRFLLALACIAFVAWYRPPLRWFWAGLCVGSVAVGLLALAQRFLFGMTRAEGFTHHPISFGDMALALGLMAFCAAAHYRRTRLFLLPLLALGCCLLASLLSGSRGGWVALLFVALPLVRYSRAISRRLVVYGAALAVLLLAGAFAFPATGVAERVALAGQELSRYFTLGDATTSIGIRLELWKASWLMFTDHPLLGVGRDQFSQALLDLAAQGRIQGGPALEFGSSHNDALYFLATGGVLDFTCLLLIYLGPLFYFVAVLERPAADGVVCPKPAAVAGLLLVLSFIAFGLTDVMFWLMAPTVFYAVMVCVLIGFCIAQQDANDEQ
jgi:O-antigen ligase